ncbi:MAG: hypothetical protein JST22_11530 [Bacteroidetes bacterium]|nr:hypothetical protein [Bacteroidota bacterium]
MTLPSAETNGVLSRSGELISLKRTTLGVLMTLDSPSVEGAVVGADAVGLLVLATNFVACTSNLPSATLSVLIAGWKIRGLAGCETSGVIPPATHRTNGTSQRDRSNGSERCMSGPQDFHETILVWRTRELV